MSVRTALIDFRQFRISVLSIRLLENRDKADSHFSPNGFLSLIQSQTIPSKSPMDFEKKVALISSGPEMCSGFKK